jgi:hypothetical protein
MEYGNTPPLHHSTTPPLHHSGTPCSGRSLTRRLAGLAVAAGLLAATMTGCGPSSDKAGKQPATNTAAPQAFARRNQGPVLRPVLRTNLPPAAARAAARTNLPPATARAVAKNRAALAAGGAAKANVSPAAARTGAGTNAALAAAKAGAGIAETSRRLQANSTLELAVGAGLLCLAALFIVLAKARSGPLPAWLKWGCRLLGGFIISASLLPLALSFIALWLFLHSSGLGAARQEQLLAAILGGLTGQLLVLGVGVWLLRLSWQKAKDKSVAAPAVPPARAKLPRKATRKVAIHSCNVLQVGAQARQLWQFEARGRGFVLNREQTSLAGEPLPARLIAKDWRSLWQRKLNVAWLPPEQVFLRVAQFPASDFDETLAMVELQLEKLSPMPVTQIVWSIFVLPHAEGSLQTVIVMIVARNAVEEFLGQLEGQGYLADRLELPLLDQLQVTAINRSGAWIYPEAPGGRNAALVAWWYGGSLRNLDLVTLPPAKRPESLKEQLLQMAWAGELEGWLTAPPLWHLVADAPTAAEWEPALRAGLEQPVEVIAPVPAGGLAALTATRAAQAGPQANLLPAEFFTRYHQQFVDRLWMRGLGAVVALYLAGVLVYFARLQVELYRTHGVEQKVAELGPTYTNAIQLRDRFKVLKDEQELKFAALDCYKTVAELLPDGITLDGYNFSEGKKLTLSGSAPADQVKRLLDFDSDIRKAVINGQPLFDPIAGDHVTYRSAAGGNVSWSCVLEIKRSEAL